MADSTEAVVPDGQDSEALKAKLVAQAMEGCPGFSNEEVGKCYGQFENLGNLQPHPVCPASPYI